MLLPSEDAEAYETHLLQYLEEYQPVGVRETELIQNLADTQWRLDRIPSLENGIFALGRMRYAELFEDPHLLDVHILMAEAKHFKNLHLQESRLRRYYQQDVKELKEFQVRRKKEQEEKEQTRKAAATEPKSLAATASGFEFTTVDLTPAPQNRDREEPALISLNQQAKG